jgi:signal transduction histidine kinase
VIHRLSALGARIRAAPPEKVDFWLAGFVLVEGVIELIAWEGTGGFAALPVIVLVALAAYLRRRFPVGAIAVATAGIVLSGFLPDDAVDGIGGPFLFTIFLVFSMALRVDGPRLWAGAAMVFAGGAVNSATDQFDDGVVELLFVAALLVGAPVAAGRLVRSRNQLAAALQEKAARSDRDRDRRAETAVNAERARIAGELHDVVAHALGAMTVQAAAARRLAEKDPARAGGAFLAIEQTGREALSELRRLLGVMRREDEELALAPQPRLAHLADLGRRTTAAGLPVVIDVEGSLDGPLPAGVDLVAYRVVQEALGEALQLGGAGHAEVHVRYSASDVVVEIVDDGRVGDRRLLGMRERVRVYGGDFEALPQRGGGHRVRARLPLEAPA